MGGVFGWQVLSLHFLFTHLMMLMLMLMLMLLFFRSFPARWLRKKNGRGAIVDDAAFLIPCFSLFPRVFVFNAYC
jgi:hypothetical protein